MSKRQPEIAAGVSFEVDEIKSDEQAQHGKKAVLR